MKFQPQHNSIDPDVPAPKPQFDFAEIRKQQHESGAPALAYVIGGRGVVLQEPANDLAAAYPAPPRPWVKPLAGLLFVAFLGLTAWNLSGLVREAVAPPAPSPLQLKQALYLGVMKVDAFRRTHGATPTSLQNTDLPEDFYSYRRIDETHYVLSFRVNGAVLEYDSNIPKQQFFGSPQAILPTGAGR